MILMNKTSKEIRENILRISHHSGHGHIPTCFSVVEILFAIYNNMSHNPKNPNWKDRDLFVLSKAHAALGYYCILAHFGYFDIKKVSSFGSFLSDFGGHADRFKVPGVEVSAGSLGHGIGIAVGMALGLKIKKSKRRVYTLIGDGEANEGTVWESIMVANNLNLSNLTIIYDDNKSHTRGLQLYSIAKKFRAFGCEVSEVDGHDINALNKEIIRNGENVRVIVAKTKKGCGCHTFVDNHYEWHRKSPDDKQLKKLLEELYEETI